MMRVFVRRMVFCNQSAGIAMISGECCVRQLTPDVSFLKNPQGTILMPIRFPLAAVQKLSCRWKRHACVTLALLVCVGIGAPACRAQDNPRPAAVQFSNQAQQAANAGQYDRAIDLYQRALDGFQRIGDKQNVSVCLSNLGVITMRLGQHKKAQDFFERGLAITDESDPAGLSSLLSNVGALCLSTGQLDAAIRYFNRALPMMEKLGDRQGYAITLDQMAQAFSRMRQFDKALSAQTRALEIIQPTGNLRDIARIMSNIGTTNRAKGDHTLATRYLTEALNLKRQFAPPDELIASLTNLALIYFDQGRMTQASEAFAEALTYQEAVSREIRDASKVGNYQNWFRSSLYRRYAHALLNLKKPGDALAVLERGRGQGLARQAAQTRADSTQYLGTVDSQRLKAAQAEVNAADAELRKTDGLEFLADSVGNSPATQLVRNARLRYDNAVRTLSELRAELSARNPDYRQLSGSAPPSAAELKAVAAKNPDTLYLQWAVGAESTSLVFVLSKTDGIQGFVIEGGERAVVKQVQEWRAAIEKQDEGKERAAAQALYKTLFTALDKAKLLEPGRHERLVLAGDGPLLDVPWAALLGSDGKRLIERYPVAVTGSFGVLNWAENRAKPSAPLFVAADPTLEGKGTLPAARAEGKQVAALFPGARLLVGDAATKPQVMQELGKFRVLHFATHGLLDAEDGLSCGLVLTTLAGGDLQLLEARDLLGMRLSARLAVLSACDTGQGEKSGGEGLLGLTWAFRAAGCPSIVASLWSVEDSATGKLMVQFYTGLKAGERKDDALRTAMLSVKKDQSAPFYWSAFQVNGDTSALTRD
jgi:CHAT domain-containing protein/tetratricopeptide (TPR) repeat protein